MLRALTLITAAIVASTTFASAAPVKKMHRFAIFDANSGKKIFDDGKLDGKACAVGKRAIFNPVTGNFIIVPAAKCTF